MMILTTPLAVFAVVACVEGFDFAFGGGVELRYDLLTEAPLIHAGAGTVWEAGLSVGLCDTFV
jgi:hypothetical protein